jgi:uncharacterized protein (DUF58 family)
MDRKEILKKQIKDLEIRSNKLVNEVFAGQYQSVFKGRGMEFSEVREYQIGDDFRDIDRNVSARYSKPFVKIFSEEREMTVLFLIDLSASLYFSGSDKLKAEVAAEVAAILAYSALKNNDRAGMISFTDKIEKIIPPKKGKNNILRMISEILDHKPQGLKTSIVTALRNINQIWKRKAVVFLISDFQDNDYLQELIITSRHHDIVCIKISDRRERQMPNIGIVEMMDPETLQTMLVDTSSCVKQFDKDSGAFDENTEKILKRSGVDVINLSTEESYIVPLTVFFKDRQKRRMLG